jgi:outer membrane protein OmpA-like peptidoglycan-associated protein
VNAGNGATASSLTDVMASLMAIFVLLFVASQNNRGVGMKTARDEIIRQLRGELTKAGIDAAAVDSVPNDLTTVVVILPDSVLFDRGKSRMSDGGRRVVRSATPLLAGVLCAADVRPKLDQLVVEGHTDNTIPYGMNADSGRRYNLELSQRRSMDFVTTSTTELQGNAMLGCYLQLVSATGRGQEDPIAGVAEDAAPQRRVVLRVRLRTADRETTPITLLSKRE